MYTVEHTWCEIIRITNNNNFIVQTHNTNIINSNLQIVLHNIILLMELIVGIW